jgi:hypothetical protein
MSTPPDQPPPAHHASDRIRSPRVITAVIMALWALIAAGYQMALALLALRGNPSQQVKIEAVLHIALGVLALAVFVGALRVRSWAWVAFMTWAVIGLTDGILRMFFFGDPDYLSMAAFTVVVFLITPYDVQVAFGVRLPRNVSLASPTRNPLDRH